MERWRVRDENARSLLGGMSNGQFYQTKKNPIEARGTRLSGSRRRAEVAFHKWRELVEVNWLEQQVTYDDYLADFSADFDEIRGDERSAGCLAPATYVASQKLADELLAGG